VISSDDLARLLSLISHEIRGPLGVVRGYLRLLEQQPPDQPGLTQAIAASLRATDRAAGILDQVSRLARLHQGEIVLSRRPVPLPAFLRTLAEHVVLPAEAQVTLHVGSIPDAQVLADEGALRTTLAALASAVARAQPEGTRVYFAAHASEDERNRIAITITAMAPVQAEHREVPLDLTRGGVGLDLVIAAFVVDAHDGHIRERRHNSRLDGVVVWLPTA
jgi:signal transduction histidine kinase